MNSGIGKVFHPAVKNRRFFITFLIKKKNEENVIIYGIKNVFGTSVTIMEYRKTHFMSVMGSGGLYTIRGLISSDLLFGVSYLKALVKNEDIHVMNDVLVEIPIKNYDQVSGILLEMFEDIWVPVSSASKKYVYLNYDAILKVLT